MPRTALLTLLLLTGCTSAGPATESQQLISIDVVERTPVSATSNHLYRVQVRNESDQTVLLQSIRLDPAYAVDLEFLDATQSVNATIEPTRTAHFDLWVTAKSGSGEIRGFIEYVRVTVAYRTDQRTYVKAETVHINAAANAPR